MYNPNFTFRYLKTRVTIGDVLAAYGLDSQLKRRNDQLYGPCPLHHGDNPTAFRVHLTRGMWRCFTACGGGDTVDLIRCIENCSYAEAARHLYPDNIARWGKWRFPKGFPKGKILYNAPRAESARAKGIVVVECPRAAMRLT